jgi:hypothetical protein
MDIKIEFTDKEISPWGGIAIFKRLIEKSQINRQLEKLAIPAQGSNRGYDPIELINNFWVGVWCGANKFEQLEVIRQDKVIQEIFQWKKMPGHKAFERYFDKYSQAINQKVFSELYKWFLSQIEFDNYTLDVDSTVLTRYGQQQQGAKRGYNPKKRGRKSHHPLVAFISEVRMVANFWLRSGNTNATNNFQGFLEDTLERLSGKKIGLLRADSGFFEGKILEYLENKLINYIVAVKFYRPLQKEFSQMQGWVSLADGIEIKEIRYKIPGWKNPRRIVIVRQQIDRRPNACGKQLKLFKDEEVYQNYRYSAYVTNLDLPAQIIWKTYRDRGDAENRIKELKYDFGLESFNVKNFFATEAAINYALMAYNLMSLLRQLILKSEVHNTMKTLRYRLLAIGSYIVKDGNSKILKLSLAMKRRQWFLGIWKNMDNFSWNST